MSGMQSYPMRLPVLGIVFAAMLFAGTAHAATEWYVDDDGGADFISIQEAIDALQVLPGDILSVFGGIYNEDVNIHKSLRIVGEEIDRPVIVETGFFQLLRLGTGLQTAVSVRESRITTRWLQNVHRRP